MYKSRRSISPEELEKNKFTFVPRGLEGINPELIADIQDVVLKYGRPSPGRSEVWVLEYPGPIRITLSATDFPAIFIVGPGENPSNEGMSLLKLAAEGFVVWDKRLSVEDIEKIVTQCYEGKRTR